LSRDSIAESGAAALSTSKGAGSGAAAPPMARLSLDKLIAKKLSRHKRFGLTALYWLNFAREEGEIKLRKASFVS